MLDRSCGPGVVSLIEFEIGPVMRAAFLFDELEYFEFGIAGCLKSEDNAVEVFEIIDDRAIFVALKIYFTVSNNRCSRS